MRYFLVKYQDIVCEFSFRGGGWQWSCRTKPEIDCSMSLNGSLYCFLAFAKSRFSKRFKHVEFMVDLILERVNGDFIQQKNIKKKIKLC